MKWSDIKRFLGLFLRIANLGRQIVGAIRDFLRKKETEKKIEEVHDIVENGEIDKINDMLKIHKN
jgi:hypothetical protein